MGQFTMNKENNKHNNNNKMPTTDQKWKYHGLCFSLFQERVTLLLVEHVLQVAQEEERENLEF